LQPQSLRSRRSRSYLPWLAGLLGFLLVAFLIYQIPWVNDRLAWRVDSLRTRIVYLFNPPDEAIFVPQQGPLADVAVTTASPTPTVAAHTSEVQGTPTVTATPLPPAVDLDGVVYVDQHNRWNYCAPANVTMALKFWGWEGDRDEAARYIKPGVADPALSFVEQGFWDKNVMPYEMEDFVDSQVAGMQAVVREGGEIELIKGLIAAGFPVVVEKGYYERDFNGKLAWLGHYLFVTGYDDAGGYFVVQDAYLETGEDGTGANLHSPYEEFTNQWRSFNYLFMVVYPEERRDEVIALLGPWNDETWANQHALEIAQAESLSLSGIDQYFAWFNLGASHVNLLQYVDAASAFDFAFQLYADLGGDSTSRPYRLMWYRTGPYFAYYYSGRYQDVINLANTTLYEWISEPTLEESLYWRGLAYQALGQLGNAETDFRETIRLNPNFAPGYSALEGMGLTP
jgi:hypothetical protein